MDDQVNPYASPAESEDGSPVLASLSTPYGAIPYASAQTRANWAVAMLAIILVGNVVLAGSTWMQIKLLERVPSRRVTKSEITSNDARQALIGLVIQGAVIGSIVSFLMWFHRAHRNLPALGANRLRFTPGWAVGWWFIPFFNLVRPYEVMREIWYGSDPAVVPNHGTFPRLPVGTALIGWWWGLFLIRCLVGNLVLQLQMHCRSVQELVFLSWFIIAECAATVPAAWLAIAVVRRTTANQEERHRLLTETAPGTASPAF
jgi:hypothetical protein